MSKIYSINDCILLSHKQFINNIYEKNLLINNNDVELKSIKINANIFMVNAPYLRKNQTETLSDANPTNFNRKVKFNKKRKVSVANEDNKLITELNEKTNIFMNHCFANEILYKKPLSIIDNMEAQNFNNILNTENMQQNNFNGENQLDKSIELKQYDNKLYIIPPNCKFYRDDIKNISHLLNQEFYDFIILDPPWWNKFIRRAKKFKSEYGYKMLNDNDLINIPIEKFIKLNSLVIIWCTNAPSHINFIKSKLLPKWNLKLLTIWYWIKITNYGETICEFSSFPRKQPFEQLLITCHAENYDNELFKNINTEKYVFSVPSVIHSHKPPIHELFTKYLPVNPKCLEIFARYLLPNFTSIGLEVLKLQNMKLYEKY